MKCNLHGFRRIDMTDDSGRSIRGYSCYIGYPSNGVQGEETQKVFISDEMAIGCEWRPTAGTSIRIDFMPKGRVSWVQDDLD